MRENPSQEGKDEHLAATKTQDENAGGEKEEKPSAKSEAVTQL